MIDMQKTEALNLMTPQQGNRKAMLLIVDDQVSNVQMMFAIFKDSYEVCMATSAADALEFCENRLPDLMLVDVVMPEMDGFELCRLLKADLRTADIPVIFVTAHDDPLEEARGLGAGGVDFITKPFHAAVVQARVRTHVILKQQADQLRLQQRQLERSHAELRAINDSSPLGLFHMTTDAQCTYVNRTYESITQRDGVAAFGTGWQALVHPDDLNKLAMDWRQAAGTASRFASVLRLCLDDGSICHVQMRAAPVVIRGEVSSYVGTIEDITERRAAAITQAASERRLQQVTDAVPAMIGYVDRDECYRFCNRHYQTILGIPQQEMLGRTLEDVYGARTYAGMKDRVGQALAGTRVSFERSATRGGKTVYLQCDYVPDLADDGAVMGFYALIMDVTAYRETQQRLADSSRRLRTITENIPALVAHVDLDERYLFVNAQVGKVFDRDPTAMIGHTISEEYSPELYAFVQPHIAKVLGGRITSFEGTTLTPIGQRYYQSTYVPDKNADGAVQGFFSVTFDVTKRKQAEILQAENEKRLRTITDNLPVLITYLDREHRFQFVNATVQEWTGKSVADINGRSFVDVMGPVLYAERREHIERALAGERVEFEMTAEAFGQVRQIHSTYIPDFDENGVVRGIYTLSSDISRMKAIEHELRKHARFDSLTGLPNRPHLYEILDAALARGRRHRTAIAVFFLDIDFFKTINDLYGHAIGDLVLQAFAKRLNGAVRVTDTVARLAGDEFVIVLEDLQQQEEAEKIAAKILEVTRLPLVLEHDALHITTSVGVVFDTTLTHSASALIALADESLYLAKAAGRNALRAQRV